MQYFTGEKVFQKRPPIDPADFAKFRKRIDPEGAEMLFRISLCVNAEELTEKEDITLRRTYTREMKALKLKVRFMYGDNINLWKEVAHKHPAI